MSSHDDASRPSESLSAGKPPRSQSVPGPSATGQAAPATPQPATPQPAATQPAATPSAATQPAAPRSRGPAPTEPLPPSVAAGLRHGTVYQLTQDLVSLPESLKLRNVEWGVLFAVTGEHTVAQISDHFGLEAGEQKNIFGRLLAEGLIAEREVSYGEYLRAASTVRDDKPQTLARFLRAGVTFGPVSRMRRAAERTPSSGQPVVSTSAESTKPAASGATAAAHAPGETELLQTRAIPTFSREQLETFEPLQHPVPPPAAPQATPAATSASTTQSPQPPAHAAATTGGALYGAPPQPPERPRQLSLKRVMQFILDRAPDLNAGQLDIYRVFIRVNTKLLRRNGINTLRFEEDRLITDAELQAAITASVEKTLGLTCPQNVYLAA